ncbi:MAG: hypothetical protein SPJ13_07050 [Bacteroidales bacterium]|nr:hypothetical protein [Bacteroidales bacterium]
MKNLLFLTAMMLSSFFACALHAQEETQVKDSGTIVIENYFAKVNVDNVPADSMLYIESFSVNIHQPVDTVFMRRWFGGRNQARVEMTYQGRLVDGLQSDGDNIFRAYDSVKQQWTDIKREQYYDKMCYDYRGPLYNWRINGAAVYYQGVWDFQGHSVYRVFVMQPGRYDRNYLFEKETGLLFFIDEQDSHDENMRKSRQGHVAWRAYHEYAPLNGALYVSEESFMKDNNIITTRHAYSLLPMNTMPFTTRETHMP